MNNLSLKIYPKFFLRCGKVKVMIFKISFRLFNSIEKVEDISILKSNKFLEMTIMTIQNQNPKNKYSKHYQRQHKSLKPTTNMLIYKDVQKNFIKLNSRNHFLNIKITDLGKKYLIMKRSFINTVFKIRMRI